MASSPQQPKAMGGAGQVSWYGRHGVLDDGGAGSALEHTRRLIRYIADASTVRVRVLEQFGHAPPVDQIARMRASFVARRARSLAVLDVGEAEPEDVYHFRAGAVPFDPGHWIVRPLDCERPESVLAAPAVLDCPADVPGPPPERVRWDRRRGHELRTQREVIAAVAAAAGVKARALIAPGRPRKPVARARHLAIAVLIARGNSWAMASRAVGLRDHSTVRNALDKFFSRDRIDPDLGEAWDRLAPCVLRAARTPAELSAMRKGG